MVYSSYDSPVREDEYVPILDNGKPALSVNVPAAENKLYGDDPEGTLPVGDYGTPNGSANIHDPHSPTVPRMRSAILTSMPVFMGYAALVTLQGEIKKRMHISDHVNHDETAKRLSLQFSFAVSMIYFGNLIFRLMHNVIFSFLRPRYRVVLSYMCMASSMAILSLSYYVFDSTSIAIVFVCYILGGISVGTFESNLISCLTPMGHKTKSWAVLGVGVGFNTISMGAFILFAIFPDLIMLQFWVYMCVGIVNVVGCAFFLLRVPDMAFESSNATVLTFWSDLKRFREWAPGVAPYALSLCFDMFCVSLFSGISIYIYDEGHVPILWYSQYGIPQNVFRALYNGCGFAGDTFGRKLAYHTRAVHPFWFLVFSVVGGGIVLTKTAIAAPIGFFMVMFANGSIYSHTTRAIDDVVPHTFNLVALSFWLFVGDIGSFAGANVISPLRILIGAIPQHHIAGGNFTTVAPTTMAPPPSLAWKHW